MQKNSENSGSMRESPCLKNEAESNGGGYLTPSSSLNTPTEASVYPTHMYTHRHTPHTHTKEKESKKRTVETGHYVYQEATVFSSLKYPGHLDTYFAQTLIKMQRMKVSSFYIY